MQVESIKPRGYCYGVLNAIEIAKKAKLENPNEKVSILGMIVHNQYIVDALKELGIETVYEKDKSRLELLEMIDQGIVVLTAHGSAPIVKEKALEKGLIIYDATCKDVDKTHILVKDYLAKGYDIVYYGKKNHPECDAILGIDPIHIHLIDKSDDVDKLNIDNDKILMTNQTTISYLDALKIFALVKEKYPHVEEVEEICNATRVRQEAITRISDDVQAVYIVGDPSSNNSTRLQQLALNQGKDAYLIESVNDLNINDLKKYQKVAVSSGASTPTYLTDQVIDYLMAFDANDEKTYVKPVIDFSKII